MSKTATVTVGDADAIKAIRLYYFGPGVRDSLMWYTLCDTIFAQMNPAFGSNFVLRYVSDASADIKCVPSLSKEDAARDIAGVLKSIRAARLQAFVQVCQVGIPERREPTDAWLVSFISGATCEAPEGQAQVVFLAQPIELATS